MAFNPFNWFRKHQKVVFAGLTIIIMFVFILQFGRGDFFEQVLGRMGGGRMRGEPVIKLNGKEVTDTDIQRVRDRRKMASMFLAGVAIQGHQQEINDLLSTTLKKTELDNPLAGLREIVETTRNFPQNHAMLGPVITLRGGFNPRTGTPVLGLQPALDRLREIATREEVRNNPESLTTLARVATILGYQIWMAGDPSRNPYLFGGSPETGDILDHLVWLNVADRLGISLTDEDVIKEVIRESAGRDVFDGKPHEFAREARVLNFLHGSREFSHKQPKDLMEALRDEFRAVMAQGYLLGHEPRVRAYRSMLGAANSPAAATPDEFLDYYRDNRTEVSARLWPIAVEKFLPRVEGEPSESEQRALYRNYARQVALPSSAEPGFKEPRRVAVEYITVKPTTPYYQAQARTFIQSLTQHGERDKQGDYRYEKERARRCFTAPLLPVPGGGPLGAALAVVGPIVADPLGAEYDRYVQHQSPWLYVESDDDRLLGRRSGQLHLTSVLRPDVIAASFMAVENGAQSANAFVALSALYARATVHESHDALLYNASALLTQATAAHMTAVHANPLAAFAAPILRTWQHRPRPLSLAQMQGQLTAMLEERYAAEQMHAEVLALHEELRKHRNNEAAARKAVDEMLAGETALTKALKVGKRPVQHVRMPRTQSEAALVEQLNRKGKDESKLEALREVSARSSLVRADDVPSFVSTLFQGTTTYEPRMLIRLAAFDSPYSMREPVTLWWRWAHDAERTKSFDEARPEVIAAWRLGKARLLARAEAKRLADELNAKTAPPAEAQRYLAAQRGKAGVVLGEPFKLDDVAPLVPVKAPLRGPRQEYREYQIPVEQQDDMRYPPADLARLLTRMDRVGQATYLADQPRRHFYVAVLEQRTPRTVEEFRKLMNDTPPDTLRERFMEARREDYNRRVLEQLRREATGGKVTADGQYDIDESLRKQREGGRSDAD